MRTASGLGLLGPSQLTVNSLVPAFPYMDVFHFKFFIKEETNTGVRTPILDFKPSFATSQLCDLEQASVSLSVKWE